MQNIMPAFKRNRSTDRRGKWMPLGWLVLSLRGGQRVNEDNEGEKSVHWCQGEQCAGACLELIKYLCTGWCVHEWIHSAQRDVSTLSNSNTEAGGRGCAVAAVLTRSLKRSFMPLNVSTKTSGIMLMYHGTDEMAGIHCRRANAHTHLHIMSPNRFCFILQPEDRRARRQMNIDGNGWKKERCKCANKQNQAT